MSDHLKYFTEHLPATFVFSEKNDHEFLLVLAVPGRPADSCDQELDVVLVFS
jgi:hypothetical protein